MCSFFVSKRKLYISDDSFQSVSLLEVWQLFITIHTLWPFVQLSVFHYLTDATPFEDRLFRAGLVNLTVEGI